MTVQDANGSRPRRGRDRPTLRAVDLYIERIRAFGTDVPRVPALALPRGIDPAGARSLEPRRS